MHLAEPHRRQIICQLPANPRGLTITQQKRYYSRCPTVAALLGDNSECTQQQIDTFISRHRRRIGKDKTWNPNPFSDSVPLFFRDLEKHIWIHAVWNHDDLFAVTLPLRVNPV